MNSEKTLLEYRNIFFFLSFSVRLTGNTDVTRMHHTASMLASGKVLVAGRLSSVVFLNTVELDNPSIGI